jgi:excisionase family DNA binding protein
MKQKAVALVVRGECYDAWGAILQVRSEILLSVIEAALELGCPEEELQQIIERKELPVVRFGKQTYVNRTELKALDSNSERHARTSIPSR